MHLFHNAGYKRNWVDISLKNTIILFAKFPKNSLLILNERTGEKTTTTSIYI